jgi:hypothetical protein
VSAFVSVAEIAPYFREAGRRALAVKRTVIEQHGLRGLSLWQMKDKPEVKQGAGLDVTFPVLIVGRKQDFDAWCVNYFSHVVSLLCRRAAPAP